MVNRRSTRCTSGYTQKEELEDMNAYLISENHFMKKKNDDLAKALSELKIEHQKILQSSYELHEKLYNVDVERLKYKEFIRSMSCDMQSYIQQFITFTEQMTISLNKVNTVISSPDAINHFINIPATQSMSIVSNQAKTVAVMPMISGHTILSPKINLPRVTVKQLTDMMHSNSNEDTSGNAMEADELEYAENVLATDNEEHSPSNSSSSNEPVNQRLETMQEEDEDEDEDEDETINSQPVLSGVFRDVKVYISPLNTQHILQFKSKSLARKNGNKSRSFLNQCTKATLSPQNNHSSHTVINQDNEELSGASGDFSNSSRHTQIWTKQNNKSGNANNSTTNVGGDDPLEGPSNLLNNTQGIFTTPNAAPNQTSTPYSPGYRSKISKAIQEETKTPKRRTSKSKVISKRPTINITKRKSQKRIMSSAMDNCSVKLQNISPSKLRSYAPNNSFSTASNESTRDRPDSPTVSERSRRSSSHLPDKIRKSTDSTDTTAPKSRQKRTRKQVVYTEPSLTKKLRRSK